MKTSQFYYYLPEKFIAQNPIEKRDHSKLLLLDRRSARIDHEHFYNIGNFLNEGDVLVVNESRVLKCRLEGIKEETGAKIECFILNIIDKNTAEVLLKPSKKIKEGNIVNIDRFYFETVQKMNYGKAVVRFNKEIDYLIEKYGRVPLPPYVKNKNISYERYQTVYAEKDGSAAAPTAGFHFTNELVERLKISGITIAKLRLDIGLDTFRPIVEEEIEDHVIHSEQYYISEEESGKILDAKAKGGRVIAVGTTSIRALETVMIKEGKLTGSSGMTSLYIYPGFKFRIVDAAITNFHLPCSTLIVMISAFAGRENILKAYEEAKQNNYRFYSFGDCMFIY